MIWVKKKFTKGKKYTQMLYAVEDFARKQRTMGVTMQLIKW
jgi:hypothetical protein